MVGSSVDLDQGVIRRVAGPRGSLTLEYEGGLLSRILRADGSWTTVARENGGLRRVVAVEHSTGAVERVRYESDDRRVYVDPDGYETTYEVTGHRVRSVTFPTGLRRWYAYDRRRRLISWSDNRGGGERLTYDDHGARTAVERSDGTWQRVQRDSQGRILRVESDRGTVARYRYHTDGTVAETTDATGHSRTFTQLPGRALRITSQGHALARIQLDPRGNPIEVQRSDGRHERRVFDELNRITQVTVDGVATVERTYDRAGRLASITTADGLVTYRYGATGKPVEICRDGSTLETLRYDSTGNRTGRTLHDGTDEEFQRTPAGRITAMRLRDGSQWHVAYDARGRPVEIREESGARRREFAYARDGRVLSTFSLQEGLVEYLYDSYGAHIGYHYGDGSRHRRQVHPGGRVELETPEGQNLEIDLDAAHRPRRIRSASGDPLIYRYRADATEILRGTETVRREEVDRFGRLRAVHFPDGSSETWSYTDGGRTRVFTDRRGAVHREERDHWHRPVTFTAGDEYQVRWTYAGEWVHETRSDGTSRRYRRDAAGAVTEEHSSTAVVRRVGADRGAHRIETHTPDGQLLERLVFDAQRRLVEEWSRIGGTVRSAAYRPDGVQEHRLMGYRERREDTVPAVESVHRREGAAPVRVARTPAGLPRQVQSDDYSALISWIAPGFPAEVEVHHGDRHVHQRYTYRNDRLAAYELLGVQLRTYDTSDSGELVTIRCGDGSRAITTDPYGKILAETVQLPELPTVTSHHLRDRHGRVHVTETDVDHAPGISRQTIQYLPHRRGARITAASIALEVLDGDSETTLTIDEEFTVTVSPDALEVADLLTVRFRHGPGGETTLSTVEQSRGSGFEAVLDAGVQVRNDLGQIIAEQRIDGYTQTFEYDAGGRLTAASGGPGGVITALEPAVARELTESWHQSGVSVAPPEPRRSVNQHDLLYAGRASTQSDSAGRIVAAQGTTLAYDETSGRPQRITDDRGSAWTVVRDAAGNPVLIGDSAGERRWIASTVDYPTRGGTLQVRTWTTGGGFPQQPVARYRPGSRETSETAGAGRSAESCVEVSRNGRLLLVADQDAIYVPYTDVRGTTCGLAQINRTTRSVNYQAWSVVLPEVDVGLISPPEEGPQFPSALPYDRMVYGMFHLPDTDVLWGVERAYLPALGRFTAIDPALHHLDWFSYAAGDPVNFTDAAGLRFIPINAGLTHFQQQGWWNDDPLGDRGTATVGSSGCVLTGVSNMINTISGTSASDPGTLNWYCQEGFYREGNLLATEDTAEILQAATGHHIETISFDPHTVDMNRVASAIQDDTIQQYAATARIRTYRTNADGSIDEYQHTVNVAGFDERGQPIIHDTSTRNRTALDHREEVLRYDVYAVSNCRGY
ncbi:MAG: hypothetical protein R6U25_00515 [Alkalispirochaeta sp.]